MKSSRANRAYHTIRRLEVAALIGLVLASLPLALAFRAVSPLALDQEGGVVAYASGMPNQGWAPLTVYLTAFGSRAGAGSIARYEWDLNGDGLFETDATPQGGYARYTYIKPGQYAVSLRVTDDHGHSAVDALTIEARHPAASSVDYQAVFDDSRVRRADFQLTQANWALMWADPPAKVRVPAEVILWGTRLRNVGLSMRGQFSLRESGHKKPWKVSVDAYVPGYEYRNLKELVFVNSIGDPSMLQEKLAYELMAFSGVPASHTAFVEIWVDLVDDDAPPTFLGVYTMIERVDRKFLANRFGPGNKDGNLYKASHAQRGPMDLIYYGDTIAAYPTQNGQYAYAKVTNQEQADYDDIVRLCRVIDGTAYADPEAFARALEEVFNVDAFLRYMAVVVATMNWDTYPYTGNNYFLYHHPDTDRFEWIPWDLTWGGNVDQSIWQLQGPQLVERAPLYDRVFAVERYRIRYAAYLDLLTRHRFNRAYMAQRAGELHEMIAPYVTQSSGDKMYFGDTAMFPPQAFDESWKDLVDLAGRRSEFIRAALDQGLGTILGDDGTR